MIGNWKEEYVRFYDTVFRDSLMYNEKNHFRKCQSPYWDSNPAYSDRVPLFYHLSHHHCPNLRQLTFVEVEDGQGDFVSPRRPLLKADAVAAAAEQVSGRDEVAISGSLELQPRAVPDESL